jgi:hypothetical protein
MGPGSCKLHLIFVITVNKLKIKSLQIKIVLIFQGNSNLTISARNVTISARNDVCLLKIEKSVLCNCLMNGTEVPCKCSG